MFILSSIEKVNFRENLKIMQKKIDEIDFFNKFTNLGEYDVFLPSGYNKIIKNFRKLIGDRLSTGYKAIDLGCGTGSFTRRFFKGAKADLYGVDISLNSVILANQNKDNKIRYLTGDIENLSFKEQVFDTVVFSGVLHHFSDLERPLKESYRVLKKGGCVLAYDPNIKNPSFWIYRHRCSPFYSSAGKTDNERLLSTEEFTRVLEQAGFININTFCISGVAFKFVKSSFGRLLLPLYNLLDFMLGVSPLAKKYGSFLICYAQKN